jgi:uncharacterized protein (DUF1697 family)
MGLRVALLRGINVGGHRVKMDRLREHCAGLGLVNPCTFIASGNVVFDGREDEDEDGEDGDREVEVLIERGLMEALGYEVPTFVRGMDDLAAIAAVDSPADVAHYVGFLKGEPDPQTRAIFAGLSSDRDRFHCEGREFHWLSHGKISDSPLFGRAFDRATRDVPHTMRNMNTIRRLLAKF